jgi:glycosyltransferase involved in cell wall biosynthesis
VVTSATTSLPEVVGDAAVMVDPADTESIAEGVRRIVECADLRNQLREAGLAHAREITWDRSAAQTRRVLREQV